MLAEGGAVAGLGGGGVAVEPAEGGEHGEQDDPWGQWADQALLLGGDEDLQEVSLVIAAQGEEGLQALGGQMAPLVAEDGLAGGIVERDVGVQADEGADPGQGVGMILQDRGHAAGEALGGGEADMVQQVGLGGDVAVEAGGLQSDRLGQLAHVGGREALFAEESRRSAVDGLLPHAGGFAHCWSKSTNTSGLRGWAWQVRMKPCSTSQGSRA